MDKLNGKSLNEKRFTQTEMLEMGKSLALAILETLNPYHPTSEIFCSQGGISCAQSWALEKVPHLYTKTKQPLQESQMKVLIAKTGL